MSVKITDFKYICCVWNSNIDDWAQWELGHEYDRVLWQNSPNKRQEDNFQEHTNGL